MIVCLTKPTLLHKNNKSCMQVKSSFLMPFRNCHLLNQDSENSDPELEVLFKKVLMFCLLLTW